MSEIREAILRPTGPGTFEGGPDDLGRWEDLVNALTPDGGETYGYSDLTPGRVGNLGNFIFESVLPPYAKLHSLEFSIIGAADLVESEELLVGIYSVEVPDAGKHLTLSQRVSFSSPEFSLKSTTGGTNEIISFINGRPGLISRFGLALILSRGEESTDFTERFMIDSFFLGVSYTTPPFPWRATLQLQGEGAPQKIKQGSNAPNMQFAVTDGEGNPLDLRGAEVKLVATSRQVCCFGGPVTMVDAEKGLCLYEWKPGDTAQPGEFSLELVTDWADGTRVIIPHDDYFRIQIVPALKPELAP